MNRITTGISGLDEILEGGWLAGRSYVVVGGPGAGKTTVGMHFLAAGLKIGESGLYVSFDQSEEQAMRDADTIGLNLSEAAFLDLAPQSAAFTEMHTYDIFSPAEVEKDPITRLISSKVEQLHPRRVFIDGFSQFGHLASDLFHLRRLVQSCFRFVTEGGATLLASCDGVDLRQDLNIQSAADGVLSLETGDTRRLSVVKFRGSAFAAGFHPFQLTPSGIVVVPTAA